MKRSIALLGIALIGIVVILLSLWGTLALFYTLSSTASALLSAGFALCGTATFTGVFFARWRRPATAAFAVLWVAVFGWWSTVEPSNERVWKPEVTLAPYASVDGDLVTFHNIRNFDYRSETDFSPAYYDKTFDLRELQGVDLVASYWMGPHIAHIFLSFDFGADVHLAVSIERRDEIGEG